uniref:Uncharacterized protein n=1 Tax=Arundo donax TaxID=35708 RepID=A0A0A9FXL6_ARUDO
MVNPKEKKCLSNNDFAYKCMPATIENCTVYKTMINILIRKGPTGPLGSQNVQMPRI